MYYIGIDGGGTKTSFSIMDEDEKVIASIESGTCHYNQVGLRGMGRVIKAGIDTLIKDLSITKSSIKCVCLGIAGYGEVKSINKQVDSVLKDILGDMNYIVHSDVHIALMGALAKEDGIVIISGTGSIAYSINKGQFKRAGGWGYSIGDEGSAYWIGNKTIEYLSKEIDGRFEKGPLYYLMRDELKLDDDYDLIIYMNDKIKNSRREIAKLSKICAKAAIDKDENAMNIFKEAGFELGALINVLIKDFEGEKVKVSYIGGVFKSDSLILNPIKKNLDKRADLIAPIFSPSVGACLIAKSNEKEKTCIV